MIDILGVRANLSAIQIAGDTERKNDPEREPRLQADADNRRYEERAIEVGLIEFVTSSHLDSAVNEGRRALARRVVGPMS